MLGASLFLLKPTFFEIPRKFREEGWSICVTNRLFSGTFSGFGFVFLKIRVLETSWYTACEMWFELFRIEVWALQCFEFVEFL